MALTRWIQRLLGVSEIRTEMELLNKHQAVMAKGIAVLLTRTSEPVPMVSPSSSESKPDPETDDPVPAVVAHYWGAQPLAASATRSFARMMAREGADPRTIAKRIAENGVTIE